MTRTSGNDGTGSVTYFFGQLQAGDSAAAEQIWLRFFPRLAALARKSLAGRPQQMADADDAAQSAFASFCQRVRGGEFSIADRDDLWNLLGLITKRKARAQVRRELAEKRGGGKVLGEGALAKPDGSPLPLDEAAGELAPPEFDASVEELLDQLEPEVREIAVLRLLGYRNREIAERLDCTERKVERKLQLIRLAWEAAWPG
jgi:DNA-directed RNA polymerase specialized sigma24 family protein